MRRLLGLFVIMGTLVSTGASQVVGQTPWPDVTLTTRDYSGNIPATDRYHYPSGHPAIEKSPSGSVTHVVYVRGSSIQLDVKWRNDNDFALNGTVTWQAARLRVPGPNNNPAEQYITLNVSGSVAISLPANGESAPIPLTITGVPNYVAVGQLEIKYDMPLTKAPGQTGNNGTQGNFHGWERIPLIDAAPVGLQSTPWADLCEYSCRWAFGYSGATNVRRELTRGLHYSNRAPWNRVRYTPYGLSYYTMIGGNLELTRFLTNLSDPWLPSNEVNWVSIECHAFAAILFIAFESHGLSSSMEILDPEVGTWYTWLLCGAGLFSFNPLNYVKYPFDVHHVNRSENLRFDAAVSYYYRYDTQIWMMPATEWPIIGHWQEPNQIEGQTWWFGLCYGVVPHVNQYVDLVIWPSNTQPMGLE